MRITARLVAAVSLMALVGSAAPAWAGGSSPVPGDRLPSGSPTAQASPSTGTPSPSAPSPGTPTATTTASSSATTSATPTPGAATSRAATQADYPVTGEIGQKWEAVKSTVGDPTGPMRSVAGG